MSVLNTLALNIVEQDTPLAAAYRKWCETVNTAMKGSEDATLQAVGFAAAYVGFPELFPIQAAAMYLQGGRGETTGGAAVGPDSVYLKPSDPETYWSRSTIRRLGGLLSVEGVDALGLMIVRANDGWSREDNLAKTVETLMEVWKTAGGASFTPTLSRNDIVKTPWEAAHLEILKNGTKAQREAAEKLRVAREREERARLERERIERKRQEDIELQRQMLANPLGATW